jgi:vacuole morphology and inheritance protein 14
VRILLKELLANRGESHRLDKIVRDAINKGERDKIQTIVDQLCHDFAYAVHQPHARNGGLIGLAAASIALGSVS